MNAPQELFERSATQTTNYIGKSVTRPNARRLLDGQAVYVDDIHLPKLAHVAFVRSPYASALIRSIHTEEARKAAGVLAVYTGEQLMRTVKPMHATLVHFKGMKAAMQPCMAVDRALWQGEPVVAVVAESIHQAIDAAQLVEVSYEPQTAVTDMETALDPATPVIHPELGDNLCFSREIDEGEFEESVKSSAVLVERVFRFPRHTGVCLEGRSVIGDYSRADNKLTVYISHQAPNMVQDCYARLLGLKESQVRVVCKDIGGSYGIKTHVYGDELATCAIAIDLCRPVKFVADRTESFLSDIHSRDHRVHMKMTVSQEGEIKGIWIDDLLAIGPYSVYPRTSVVEGNQIVNIAGQWYRHRAYKAKMSNVFTNMAIYSNYRAVGHPVAVGATEGLIDAVARQLKIDPVVIRRKNLLPDDAFPCQTPSGMKFEAMSHHQCLDRLVEMMDLTQLRLDQSELRGKDIFRGIGIASMIEITNPSAQFYGVGGARISAQDGCTARMDPAGGITLLHGCGEQGQGTETIFAQIAAQVIGVSIDNVKVITGDTDVTPYGGGTWASRGAGVGGEAAWQACKALRNNILELGSIVHKLEKDRLDIRDGKLVDVLIGESLSDLSELGRVAYFRPDLLGTYQAELSVTKHFVPKAYPFTFTNGAIGCHLEVDTDLGSIRLLKFWVVEDCGTVINPQLVDEQIRGAIVQGIGPTLLEQCIYGNDGQMLNPNLVDYLVPMAAEMPDMVIDHVQTPTRTTELGAKGAGEAGTAGAPAAIMNALNDALSPFAVELFDMPFTPQKILRALGKC